MSTGDQGAAIRGEGELTVMVCRPAAEFFARSQFPHDNRAVLVSRYQSLAIGCEQNGTMKCLHFSDLANDLAGGDFPEADRLMITCGDQCLAIGREIKRTNMAPNAPATAELLAGLHVGEVQLNGFVVVTASVSPPQAKVASREKQADLSLKPLQLWSCLPNRRQYAYDRVIVMIGSGHRLAIGDGQITRTGQSALGLPVACPRRGSTRYPRRNQRLSVRQRQETESGLAPIQAMKAFACSRIPKMDGGVAARRRFANRAKWPLY